jgi:hypothetical protein
MNKKVIFVLVLTLAALFLVYLYSFGPLAKSRLAQKVNPQSRTYVKQSATSTASTLNVFHNKDLKENYYSVSVPSGWKLDTTSVIAGKYLFTIPQGSAEVMLQDVADNTTLELFVLSQEEPRIKKEVSGYKKLNYQKITINSNPAYQLTYVSQVGGQNIVTEKTYVTGTDHAGVMTITLPEAEFSKNTAIINSLNESFVWENTI